MSFDRLRFQSWIEREVGCSDFTKWDSYKTKLDAFTVDNTKIDAARVELGSDAVSLYTKALVSCCGGIQDILNSQMGWGLIKLYYSLFYISRANLCARQQGLIRNRSWFRFDLTSANNLCIRIPSKYRNDHESTLFLYEDLYGASDILLTNTVAGKRPYEWMMDARNIANYRLARFSDPLLPPHIQSDIVFDSLSQMSAVLTGYMRDVENRLTFQPEHAWLAIPFKQLIQSREIYKLRRLTGVVPPEQFANLEMLLRVLPEEAIQALDLPGLLEIASED